MNVTERSGLKRALLLTAVYAAAITLISAFHEVWRDEVRALSIAIGSGSIGEMLSYLQYEGHPGLWYIILRIGYTLFKSTLVLKAASIIVAVAAVYLFVSKAPFTWLRKTLFVFGLFPIYQYSVFCRSYGLIVLLLFAFCALYEERFRRPVLISMVLFLLANTHAYGMVIVIALWISMLMERALPSRDHSAKDIWAGGMLISTVIIFTGIALAFMQIVPKITNTAINVYSADSLTVLAAFRKAFAYPGEIFGGVLGFGNSVFLTTVIWALYIYLLRKPRLMIMFAAGVIGLGMFFELVYGGGLLHKGLFYFMLVAIFWLDANIKEEDAVPVSLLDGIGRVVSAHKGALFLIILVMQLCMAYPYVRNDISFRYSSSKSLGKFMNESPIMRDAIIISEPDYLIESLPYYANNEIYFPREGRFGRTIRNTLQNKRGLSLYELIDAAEDIEERHVRPVVIVLGYELSPEGPFTIRLTQERYFVYTEKALEKFTRKTARVNRFRDAYSDENYDIYLLGGLPYSF